MDLPSASLEGRVALVTGAGQGIGKGIAIGLASYGADLIVADTNSDTLRETAAEIEVAGRRALPIEADCSDGVAFRSLVSQGLDELNHIHVLVNNVGGNVGRVPFIETDEEQWHEAIRRNLWPTLLGIRIVAPEMITRGIRGSIINVSTIEAYRASPGFSVYGAAKAGVAQLTKTLALELGGDSIRVNGIAPDITRTPRLNMGSDDQVRKMGTNYPLNRIGVPEDYVGTAVYLASDMSGWVTGETLHVGGGTMAAGGWLRNNHGQWVQSLPI